MKTYDIQSIRIEAPRRRLFEYVADPANLPRWASAFEHADAHSARLKTPQGVTNIELRTETQPEAGTVDWVMTFSDGATGTAYSRITPDGERASIFAFVLMAPP